MDKEKRFIGNPNNNRKSNSVLLERCFRLLDYLKRNTDSEHTITQAELRRDTEISGYLGGKKTFNRLMQNLTLAMNTNTSDEIKPEEEWRLVYKAFKEFYGEIDGDDDADTTSVRNIYYNHIFTKDEITEIITSLQMSKTADNETTERIIKKIKRELVSKHYKEYSCRIFNSEYTDSELLNDNLALIQEAIRLGRQLSYRMNYYNSKKRFVPVRKTATVISPHYIVANSGKFYVIGCFEGEEKRLSITRVDLISDVAVLSKASTPSKEIQGLPDKMEKNFKSLHLNMFYDAPVPITIRITYKIMDKNTNAEVVNHTFVHDMFGDDYKVLHSDSEGDTIRVMCSPFAARNFALQYSDVVEVLTPDSVRNEIKAMIKKLNSKYDVKGEEI